MSAPAQAEPDAYPGRLVGRLQDGRRLQMVRSAPLDGPWRERARVIAALAAQMLDTQIAEVNLVTDTHLLCVASAAGPERQLDVDLSFCQHVVGTEGCVVVYDSRTDALVSGTPGAQAGFCYLGVPLVVGGEVVGALCVAGTEPRAWTEVEVCLLTQLVATLQSGEGWADSPGAAAPTG